LLFAGIVVLGREASLLAMDATPLAWGELVRQLWRPETVSRVIHAILAAGVMTGVVVMRLAVARPADHPGEDAPPGESPHDPNHGGPHYDAAPSGGAASGGRAPFRGGDAASALLREALTSDDRERPGPADSTASVWGGRMALAAGLAQIPVGVWVLAQMPTSLREQFLAADWLATGLFVAALLVMLGLLHQLASAALGDVGVDVRRRCMMLTVILFFCMVGAGHRARMQIQLAPEGRWSTGADRPSREGGMGRTAPVRAALAEVEANHIAIAPLIGTEGRLKARTPEAA